MKKGMVTYMMDQVKKRMAKGKYVLLTLLILGAGFFLFGGDFSYAATPIYITYNGEDLSESEPYKMTTRYLQLTLRTEGNTYDSPDYKVDWTIETPSGGAIASVTPGTSKTIGVVEALSPGEVKITATVKDGRNGDVEVTHTTCLLSVQFAVDTSKNDSIYKFVHKTDEMRSLVLYSDSQPEQLKLNFGSANDQNTQWTIENDNEEVFTVGQHDGILTPVGAGHGKVIATYTPSDTPGTTYSAYLDVYIIPRVSVTQGEGYRKNLSAELTSGQYLYTDTVFSQSNQRLKGKIAWVVRKDDNAGNSVIIADSFDRESDLIQIKPAALSNELQITGVAGEYHLYFYALDSYDRSENDITAAYTPTVVNLTIKSDIHDRTEILGIGDVYNFAESYNMTAKDFVECFSTDIKMAQGGDSFAEYADYDPKTTALTGKKVGDLIARLSIRDGKEADVRRLLGMGANESLPQTFITRISITDNIQLNRTSMTISVGQKEQLSIRLNSTYTGTVTWSSSSPDEVAVDGTGMIEGKKVTSQDVIITATLDAGNGVYKTATCAVKVEATVSDFTLDPGTDQQMLMGEHLTIVANVNQTVTVAPLHWISSNTSILTVEEGTDRRSAILTAVGAGRATLTVYNTISGEYKSLEVSVRIPIDKISFKAPNLQVEMYKNGYNMKDEVSWGPANATDTELVWTTSNSSVATMDKNGYMTFKGPGTALISVYPAFNPYNIMASCLVTVVGKPDSMTISQTDVTVDVGDSTVLQVDFSPKNTSTGITWTPNEKGIVKISYDEERRLATLTGESPGSTNINVVTTEGLISTIKVTVKQPSTALNLEPNELTVRTGESESLKPNFTPANSTDTLEWKSYNTELVTVDDAGCVTGLKAGTTFVQATAYNGKKVGPTSIIQVTVRDGVKGISLDSLEKTVRVGSAITLTPIFDPETAFDKQVTWTASNDDVKLEPYGDSNVKVSGVKAGATLVTGTTSDGGFSVSCLIKILPKPVPVKNDTKVTVSPKSKFLNVGKSFYVTATVTGAPNKKVKWSSNKKSVATVTQEGKVKAKKVGTAYIKATAANGSGACARCKVRVIRKVKKIKLNKYSGRLLVGNTMKLKATVTPKNATIKSVKWTTNKKSVATVSSSGRVLGVGEGIVKIKATAKDGTGKSATCIIRVSEPVEATGVTVANSQVTVAKGKTVQSGITLNPVNSTTTIKYRSDNLKVATVNKYGKVKTKRVGQATIYGSTPTGLYGYCDVLVVDLNRKAVNLRQYDTEQLKVNEISTGVTWYSRNINVATVSPTGLVTGRRKGTTTVYAVVNGVKLGCRVTVKKIK